MKVHAHVVAVRGRDGSTLLRRLCGGGPLSLRPTSTLRRARVHLVAGTFGPLGGDDLTLHVTVEPEADLEVVAVAATIALPSRTGESSSMRIRLEVAESARLIIVMPPTVICAGARHTIDTQGVVAADGELLLREEAVRGRSGEPGGEVTLRTRLDVGAAPVLHQTIALRGAVGGPWSPRAVGGLLHVSPGQKPPMMDGAEQSGASAAWLSLPREAGHQLTALGADPLALSRLLDGAQRQLPR